MRHLDGVSTARAKPRLSLRGTPASAPVGATFAAALGVWLTVASPTGAQPAPEDAPTPATSSEPVPTPTPPAETDDASAPGTSPPEEVPGGEVPGGPQPSEAPPPEPRPGGALAPPEAEGATLAPTTRGPGVCDANWFSRVYDATYRSVVRIDTGRGGLGAGFGFHDLRTIATAYHVIAGETLIVVTFAEGTRMAAEVVAVDEGNDVALLRLPRPAPTPVLPVLEAEEVALGTPVVAIGHPYAIVDDELERLLTWSISQGIVSGSGPRLLQTDAALNPGNSGGPLIDCEGRVVGVVSGKLQGEGIGFVIPSRLLAPLLERVGEPLPDPVSVRLGLELGMVFHGTPEEALLGFEGGLELRVAESWSVALRGGHLFGVREPPLAPDEFSRSRRRTLIGLDGGYRLSLVPRPWGLGLGLRVGGMVSYTETDRVLLAADPVGPCSTCPVPVRRTDLQDELWRVHPAVGLDLIVLGAVELGYTFIPVVTDVERSIHQGTLRLALGL